MSHPAPQAHDSERAVLGALLVDPKLITQAQQYLSPEDFFNTQHMEVFSALEKMTLEASKNDIALESVILWLERANRLEQAGGSEHVNSLVQYATASRHIEFHARQVRDASMRRQLLQASLELQDMAIAPGKRDTRELIHDAEKTLLTIDQKGMGVIAPQRVDKLLEESVKDIEERSEGKGDKYLLTGFAELDKKIMGLLPSNLVILAARPGMGKTALGLNIATNVAMSGERAVLFFSMEMSKDELAKRMLAERSGVPLQTLRRDSGELTRSEWKKVNTVVAEMNQKKTQMHIDDTPGLTPTDLRGQILRHVTQLRAEGIQLGLIVVDYLQLMRVPDQSQNRVAEVSEISRSLKEIAREYNLTVLALAQLNRAVDSRESKRPVLRDLRESGSIEQDADTVLMIHRPELYNNNHFDDNKGGGRGQTPTVEGETEICIQKQRNGELGIVKLQFDGQFTSFRNFVPSLDDDGPEYDSDFAADEAARGRK